MAPVSPPLASSTYWTISRRERSDGPQRQHPFEGGEKPSKAIALPPSGYLERPVTAHHLRIGLKRKHCVARPHKDHADLQIVCKVFQEIQRGTLLTICSCKQVMYLIHNQHLRRHPFQNVVRQPFDKRQTRGGVMWSTEFE